MSQTRVKMATPLIAALILAVATSGSGQAAGNDPASAEVMNFYSYSPYGCQVTGSSGPHYGFDGYTKVNPAKSGCNYDAYAREYIGSTGSFTGPDPLLAKGSPYTYANGDPVNLRDPDGLSPQQSPLRVETELMGPTEDSRCDQSCVETMVDQVRRLPEEIRNLPQIRPVGRERGSFTPGIFWYTFNPGPRDSEQAEIEFGYRLASLGNSGVIGTRTPENPSGNEWSGTIVKSGSNTMVSSLKELGSLGGNFVPESEATAFWHIHQYFPALPGLIFTPSDYRTANFYKLKAHLFASEFTQDNFFKTAVYNPSATRVDPFQLIKYERFLYQLIDRTHNRPGGFYLGSPTPDKTSKFILEQATQFSRYRRDTADSKWIYGHDSWDF